MIYQIRPIAQGDIESFRDTMDVVAREKRFLSFLEAPPIAQIRTFVLNNIKERYPQFVVAVGGQVVGWCDVLPNPRRAVQIHCGTLGIGLLPEFRGQGIGRKLMQQTVDAALGLGLTRIDLTVREANLNAIALYKKLGFEIEGSHRNAVCIDGRYENSISMAFVAS